MGDSIVSLLQYDGYLEHLTHDDLYKFHNNVGKGGYTIFAEMVLREYGVNYQGYPWCVTFVYAVHPQKKKLGKPCMGVMTLLYRMILHFRWRGKQYMPIGGDLIFCRNAADEIIGHVGIVLCSDENTVLSIDGNTVDPTGVFNKHDGGAVALRQRYRNDPHIVGYAAIGGFRENIYNQSSA